MRHVVCSRSAISNHSLRAVRDHDGHVVPSLGPGIWVHRQGVGATCGDAGLLRGYPIPLSLCIHGYLHGEQDRVFIAECRKIDKTTEHAAKGPNLTWREGFSTRSDVERRRFQSKFIRCSVAHSGCVQFATMSECCQLGKRGLTVMTWPSWSLMFCLYT
eukprot:2039428-Rhodomonas_salina.5